MRRGTPDSLRPFLRRVWQQDITPLLRGKYASRRRKAARTTGTIAAATGLLVDSLFHLRGRPFTRFMTVLGASVGAMLPDAWSWEWFRRRTDPADRELIAERVRSRAAELPEAEALALFELPPQAGREDLQRAWREVIRRWHPDKACDEAQRAEFHIRFVAFQAAYERLCCAYDRGVLPLRPRKQTPPGYTDPSRQIKN